MDVFFRLVVYIYVILHAEFGKCMCRGTASLVLNVGYVTRTSEFLAKMMETIVYAIPSISVN